jgi:hypothetical protein
MFSISKNEQGDILLAGRFDAWNISPAPDWESY